MGFTQIEFVSKIYRPILKHRLNLFAREAVMADLTFPMARLGEGHRVSILQPVGGKAALSALQNDQAMRQADCGDFVLQHRGMIMGRLLA